jgi:hypothetical protein
VASTSLALTGSKAPVIDAKKVELTQSGRASTALMTTQKNELIPVNKTGARTASTSSFMDGDDLGFAPIDSGA